MKKCLCLLLSFLLLSAFCTSALGEDDEYYINVSLLRYSGDSLNIDITVESNCPTNRINWDIYYPDGSLRSHSIYNITLTNGQQVYSEGASYNDYDGDYLMVFYYEDCRTEVTYTIENSDRYRAWYDRFVLGITGDNTPGANDSDTKTHTGIPDVSVITLSEKDCTLYEGDKKEITVSSAKSLTVEIEDDSVVNASLSNGILSFTALKPGKSVIWLRTGETYESVNVTVLFDPAKSASEWAKNDIRKAVSGGYIPSSLLTDWKKSITRGEFAQTAADFLSLEQKSASPFSDTSDPHIAACYEAGIVTGVGDNKFNPGGKITRQEAAAMLFRAAKYMGLDVTDSKPFDFKDNNLIAPWAAESVDFVKSTGIMEGDELGNFNPLDEYTAEETAVTFVRLSALKQ